MSTLSFSRGSLKGGSGQTRLYKQYTAESYSYNHHKNTINKTCIFPHYRHNQ